MSDSDYTIEDRDACMIFTITRPKRLNAITGKVLDGLTQCVDALEGQPGRGLVVTAEGDRSFCAGTDLFERETLSDDQVRAKTIRARSLLVRLQKAPFISVAAINGLAFGGGLELALGCLFRLSAPLAEFSLPEIKLGLIPAYAGTQLLPLVVGPSRALDMMLTGRRVSADEALQMGLVNRIATNEAPLLDQAIEYLTSITRYSQVAIDAIRASSAAAGQQISDEGLDIERDYVISVGQSEDAREGVAAFREKRSATFKHR